MFWNMNPEVETRTVDNFIVRLRKHFEDDPSIPNSLSASKGLHICLMKQESLTKGKNDTTNFRNNQSKGNINDKIVR